MSNVRLKDLFPINVLQEIATSPAQTDYDISNINLNKVHYFYKRPTEPFRELNASDRTIITSGNTQTLRITNQTLLDDMDYLQLGLKLEDTSFEYDPNGSPSLDVLITAYNELTRVFKSMQAYNQNTLMICDTPSLTKVLPKLKDGEAWVYDATLNEFKGFPVLDLNKIADQEIIRIKQVLDDYSTNTIKPDLTTHAQQQLDAYWDATIKPAIDSHTEDKKVELTDHTTAQKQILTNARDQYLTDLQDKFDDLKLDHGIIPAGTDLHTLLHGRHWVVDITTHPNSPVIAEVEDRRGYIEVNDVDVNKVIIFYSLTGIQLVTMYTSGGWTPWENLGGTDKSYIPVGNMGANFVFTPVMFNGTSWVKADQTGADGIVVNGNTSNGRLYFSGIAEIPSGARDTHGNLYSAGEWYFLTTSGEITPDKPSTGLWQVLGRTSTEDQPKYFKIDMSEPETITPMVITESGKEAIVTQANLEAELLKKTDKTVFDQYNKFKEYKSLSDLGLGSTPTIQELITAMPDYSMYLGRETDVSDPPTDNPRFGVLNIIKIAPSRVEVTLHGTGSDNKQIGIRKGFSYNGVWKGWGSIPMKTEYYLGGLGTFNTYFTEYSRDAYPFVLSLENGLPSKIQGIITLKNQVSTGTIISLTDILPEVSTRGFMFIIHLDPNNNPYTPAGIGYVQANTKDMYLRFHNAVSAGNKLSLIG